MSEAASAVGVESLETESVMEEAAVPQFDVTENRKRAAGGKETEREEPSGEEALVYTLRLVIAYIAYC
ncbi:hypothetical protein H6P81_004832 [Aristolochia fimbriata]|uniref:Uncharacterized protein n=1 Tax=Aristolochia fimbriata TaxID=158543 RepID=A0AAV7ESV3_ARIFI|nr:hypothetical protein H6P81_004832 [Aristolochia fimbriata]